MKKTNIILSCVMAIILICLSVVGVYADNIVLNEEYLLETEYAEWFDDSLSEEGSFEEDLMPMTATRCYNYDGAKDENYAAKRGWDDTKINSAINSGAAGTSTNLANGAACTVYCYPGTRYYVVIENISRSIVQLSEFGNDDWIPDSNIVWY